MGEIKCNGSTGSREQGNCQGKTEKEVDGYIHTLSGIIWTCNAMDLSPHQVLPSLPSIFLRVSKIHITFPIHIRAVPKLTLESRSLNSLSSRRPEKTQHVSSTHIYSYLTDVRQGRAEYIYSSFSSIHFAVLSPCSLLPLKKVSLPPSLPLHPLFSFCEITGGVSYRHIVYAGTDFSTAYINIQF